MQDFYNDAYNAGRASALRAAQPYHWEAGGVTYAGPADTGLQWSRWDWDADPQGRYMVKVTGWYPLRCLAVVNDYGDLVPLLD